MEPTSDRSHDADIDCDAARQLVSADADGELRGGERLRLADHLDHCASCDAYAADVARLTRHARLRVVAAAEPDLVARVMARAGGARLGRGAWIRPALAWCGVVMILQSARPLLFGELANTPPHVARHVGASALALAIGFLFAAWKPHRASGLLPLVAALLVTTLFGTLLDTITGDRSPGSEYVHLAETIGIALLWLVAGSPGWDRAQHALRHRRAAVPTTS